MLYSAEFSADIATNQVNTDTIAVQALLLNFSKAFNSMRPDLAIDKLLSLNVNPALIQVVQSSLEHRQCRRAIRHYCGTNTFEYDDTTIYSIEDKQGTSIYQNQQLKKQLLTSFMANQRQQAAQYASDWCIDNSMLLNTDKPNTITFSIQKFGCRSLIKF